MFKAKNADDIQIQFGQRYRAQDGLLWMFTGFAPTRAILPHVRLVNPDDGRAIKIISVNALYDEYLFSPVT